MCNFGGYLKVSNINGCSTATDVLNSVGIDATKREAGRSVCGSIMNGVRVTQTPIIYKEALECLQFGDTHILQSGSNIDCIAVVADLGALLSECASVPVLLG